MAFVTDAARRGLYPEIEPFASGWMPTEGVHEIYYEECGAPGGKPMLVLHGGPGGATNPAMRRFFDPARWRVILFDQRGCGQSRPNAVLEDNDTWKLIEDIERLRERCGVDKWAVFGGSWGSTLALAYAITHPERVESLILRGIFLLTQKELSWFYQDGASMIFPDAWESFLAPIPEAERGDLIGAYRRCLTGEDPAARIEAARAWSLWEGETITLLPEPATSDPFADGHFALAFARIENHYFVHGGWLEEGQLLRDAHRLKGIPGLIVHGRYDMPCPARYAWELARAWPDAEFFLVEGAGHAYSEPGILDRLIYATDKFAGKA